MLKGLEECCEVFFYLHNEMQIKNHNKICSHAV